jgi:hypothetical protein
MLGLGTVLGARVLGEFGDDPDCYADAKAGKNHAGTSPVARRSRVCQSSSLVAAAGPDPRHRRLAGTPYRTDERPQLS